MFGVGLQEFMLVAVVALLILGPKRLPSALRSLGLLQRRVGSAYRSLRWELERQVQPEDFTEHATSQGDKKEQPDSASHPASEEPTSEEPAGAAQPKQSQPNKSQPNKSQPKQSQPKAKRGGTKNRSS